jgi:hypothetical protein
MVHPVLQLQLQELLDLQDHQVQAVQTEFQALQVQQMVPQVHLVLQA